MPCRGPPVPAAAIVAPAGTPGLTPPEPPAVTQQASAAHLLLGAACAAAADHLGAAAAQPGPAIGVWTTDACCLLADGSGVAAACSAALTVLGPATELLWVGWA